MDLNAAAGDSQRLLRVGTCRCGGAGRLLAQRMALKVSSVVRFKMRVESALCCFRSVF